MKKTLLLALAFFATTFGFSQTERAWKQVTSQDIKKNINVEREMFPQEFYLMQLDIAVMRQKLSLATDRFSRNAKGVIISLPNSEGVLERFEVFEASNFDAELQAQYPNIRAYAGKGLDDKTAQIRLSFGVNSLQTMVFRADKATEFMEPYTQDATIFAVYSRGNVTKRAPFTCLTVEEQHIADLGRNGNENRSSMLETGLMTMGSHYLIGFKNGSWPIVC